MSKVFNMVGGGGKNISSIIITGPESTDTVTCTKDGKSYTATWDSAAQHWEIVGLPLGTFTITATNGTKTSMETVLIDVTGVYEVEMSLKLWLYKDGDECENITGYWSAYSYRYNNYNTGKIPTITKNNSDIYVELTDKGESAFRGVVMVNNPINIDEYSSLKIHVINASGYTDTSAMKVNTAVGVVLSTTKGDGYIAVQDSEYIKIVTLNNDNINDTIISVDVSNLSGNLYPIISLLAGGSVSYARIRFDKVWFE